jgi:hypothetical protein
MERSNNGGCQMKVLLLSVLCTFSGFSAEQPVRELSTQAVPAANSIVPLFRRGFLVMFPPGAARSDHPAISSIKYGFSVYAPDGSFAFNKNIEVPEGSQPVVRDVDFDTDGNVVVAASAQGGPSGFLMGILLLDRTGRQMGFINTGRYFPARVAIASDHSIWTLGWQMAADHPPNPDRQDYMIIRHYSADGKKAKEYLPRSSFPAGLEPGSDGTGVHIGVTHDRVGILAYSGETGVNAEWIELDLDGNLLSRSRVDSVIRGVAVTAFTEDDHVYLEGYNGEVYTIDTASHVWRPIPKHEGTFMGVEGTSLVYRQRISGPIQLRWFNQP